MLEICGEAVASVFFLTKGEVSIGEWCFGLFLSQLHFELFFANSVLFNWQVFYNRKFLWGGVASFKTNYW